MVARECNRLVSVARALILQGLLPFDGPRLCIEGTAGFLLEGTCVLTVNPDQCSGPAIAYFMIAQDEPFGFALGEERYGR